MSGGPTQAGSDAAVPQTQAQALRRMLRNAVVLTFVIVLGVMGYRYVTAIQGGSHSAHLASAPVRVLEATREDDGIHVRAQLDAPSPDGTSHQIKGVIPEATWALTQTVWACYPPKSPADGFLRTPFDPACADMQR